MTKTKYDIDRDLYELTTMALSLEQYVTSDEVYYAANGKFSKVPTMTLGTFLMRLRRISALQQQLDVGARAQLGIAIQSHEYVLSEWEFHYRSKLEQELEVRMRSLRVFLDELTDLPGSVHDMLPELLARTAIEELMIQASDKIAVDPILRKDLEILDAYWDSVTYDSYFRWDEKLRKVYPQNNYWWLYRELDLKSAVA